MMDTETKEITITYPEAVDLHLHIRAGGCHFEIKPGEGEDWIRGTYRDPSGRRSPKITQEGGTVRIDTFESPVDEVVGAFAGLPKYELALGKAQPFTLIIESGAGEFDFDAGGIPLKRLEVKQGAGKYEVDFSAPNPEPMSLVHFGTGAGSMEVTNLANANCAEMRFEGGAAYYKFDFGGILQQSSHVRIATGMSSVEIAIPADTAAKITSDALLAPVDLGQGFTRKAGGYWTEAATRGESPTLTIRTSVALGALKLRTT
jgi:hypothetical protein